MTTDKVLISEQTIPQSLYSLDASKLKTLEDVVTVIEALAITVSESSPAFKTLEKYLIKK